MGAALVLLRVLLRSKTRRRSAWLTACRQPCAAACCRLLWAPTTAVHPPLQCRRFVTFHGTCRSMCLQVAKADELSKLHKERRKHQLALQTGRPEKRRSGKDRDGKRKRRKGSGSGSDSDSGSGSESSGSGSSDSGSSSESESEEERGRRKGGKRRRSRSRSKERSGKRGRKEKRSSKDKKRGSKEKKKKREKEKKAKKERREKAKAKAKVGAGRLLGWRVGGVGWVLRRNWASATDSCWPGGWLGSVVWRLMSALAAYHQAGVQQARSALCSCRSQLPWAAVPQMCLCPSHTWCRRAPLGRSTASTA